MFKRSFYSNIGANQPIAAGTINLGDTRGRGSSTRMFNYCKKRSSNPSGCINQFITTYPRTQPTKNDNNGNETCVPVAVDITSVATFTSGPNVWELLPNVTIGSCEVLTINPGVTLGLYASNITFTNNGTIVNNGSFGIITGIFNNNGIVLNNNTKTISTSSGTFNNNGSLNNRGTVNNAGTFNNFGAVNNGNNINCTQGSFNNISGPGGGIFTGNLPTTNCG